MPNARARFSRIGRHVVGALLALAAARCETFDEAPRPYLRDAVDGLLPDPSQPLVVAFTKPVKPESVHAQIVRYDLNVYGQLADEDDDPSTNLQVFFSSDVGDASIGSSVLAPTHDALTITLAKPLPVGPRLAVLLSPGLADDEGSARAHRQRVPFGYEGVCSAHEKSQIFHDGTYFMLIAVTKPLPVVVQLFAAIALNDDGTFRAHFTDATRNREQPCPMKCDLGEACRLLPAPACVAPSEKAGSADEWPDFVPNLDPGYGFDFPVTGCVGDQEGAAILQGDPVDIVVDIPPVTLGAAKFTGEFAPGADGLIRASGSLTSAKVLIADGDSGSGEGSFTAVEIPADKVPAGVIMP